MPEKYDRELRDLVRLPMTDHEKAQVGAKLADLYVSYLEFRDDAAEARRQQRDELLRREKEITAVVSDLRQGTIEKEVPIGEVFDLKAGLVERWNLEADPPALVGTRELTDVDRQRPLAPVLVFGEPDKHRDEPAPKTADDEKVEISLEAAPSRNRIGFVDDRFLEEPATPAIPPDDGLEGFVGPPVPSGFSPSTEAAKAEEAPVPTPAKRRGGRRKKAPPEAQAGPGEAIAQAPGPQVSVPVEVLEKLGPPLLEPASSRPGYADALAKIKAATADAQKKRELAATAGAAFRPPGAPGDLFGRASPSVPTTEPITPPVGPPPKKVSPRAAKKAGLLDRVKNAFKGN